MNSDSLDEGSNPFIQAFVQGAQSRAVTYTQNAHPDSVQKKARSNGCLHWECMYRHIKLGFLH